MKAALIVGGDHVGNIKQKLNAHGVERVSHWSGRKAGDSKQIIPQDTQLVVIVIDWISHSLADKIKRNARKLGLQILYARGNGGNLHRPLSILNATR